MPSETRHERKRLLSIARNVNANRRITPEDATYLLDFTLSTEEHPLLKGLQLSAFPVSIGLGALFAAYPAYFERLFSYLPSWTNASPELQAALDYMWTIIGAPVERANLLFHLPNFILYSFGILGVKYLVDSLNRRNWLDLVMDAQEKLKTRIEEGSVQYELKAGHTILFTGKGDFIAQQYTMNCPPDESITISEIKPPYSSVWNHYRTESHYADLESTLDQAQAEEAGEYVFFPVQDLHIFLPSESAFDLAPHKIDLLVQHIRTVEKRRKWARNRIVIVGDRFHKSTVRTEDGKGVIDGSEETISLESIAGRYKDVDVLDPTDIVLKRILKMANERKIVFRATVEGAQEYKKRFYERLRKLGYEEKNAPKGLFIVGYDLFEDQIEQQTLCTKHDDYYPVVLSRNVLEALLVNGFKREEIIYVPDLVLEELSQLAKAQ